MDESLKKALAIVKGYNGPKLRIMEVCGTHTHEIFKLGIRKVLPDTLELISGPGCPVCVTPVEFIDEAILLALDKNVTVCTFGDLIRVPGSKMSLAKAREQGAEVKIVYTPLDAVDYAIANPEKEVVFLAVGFETTTPAACLAVKRAIKAGITNFSILAANKTMPNAYQALKGSADAFLYPGHVNAITGEEECRRLAQEDGISGVIAGFTAKEILIALAVIVEKSKEGKPFFVNCYPRVVKPEGAPAGMRIIEEMMEPCDTQWRGLGVIENSGNQLKESYAAYDARKKYMLPKIEGRANPACRCGEVLQGKCKPIDCKVFGKGCTPQHPIGACMVSNEGTCAAYYQYGGV